MPASGRRRAFLEHRLQLAAQLRRVLMLVHRHRVLDRGFEQFVLAVGAQRDRAVGVARILAAIDKLACHDAS
ncbi:hypothetical protein CBM2595_A30434 [Cupriavidus taiwanensis]|nr:hypothetical protein CBM2595_A30434 [Cupriavidus taiwanensis]